MPLVSRLQFFCAQCRAALMDSVETTEFTDTQDSQLFPLLASIGFDTA